jgi:lysozyme family protein
MSFTRALSATLQHEGGYSNNPKDQGGATYMGIARNKHPQWGGWPIVDDCLKHSAPLSLADGLADLVRDFYLVEFWRPLQCPMIDQVSEAVAEELFEASVNCGIANGVKFLQRALNALNNHGKRYPDLTVDGAMGPKTLQTTLTCLVHRPPRILVKCQNGEQYIHYKNWSYHEDFPGVFERV